MPDIMTAITKKKAALLEKKRGIQIAAERQIEEIDKEIAEVEKALQTLNDAVKDYICPVCKGTGNERYADAAGSRDERPCSACKGTGVKI